MKERNWKRILEVRPTLKKFKEVFAELKIIYSILEKIPHYTEDIFGDEINTPYEFYQRVKKHKENLACYISNISDPFKSTEYLLKQFKKPEVKICQNKLCNKEVLDHGTVILGDEEISYQYCHGCYLEFLEWATNECKEKEAPFAVIEDNEPKMNEKCPDCKKPAKRYYKNTGDPSGKYWICEYCDQYWEENNFEKIETLKCSKCKGKDFHIGYDPTFNPSEVAICEFCGTSNSMLKDKPTNEKICYLPDVLDTGEYCSYRNKPKDSKMEKILSQIDMKPKDLVLEKK